MVNAINSIYPVYQIVRSTSNSLVTCTTVLPADDTIPQNDEGDEVITATITPKSATSKLFIEFYGQFNISTTGRASFALFQDSTAGALAATGFRFGFNGVLHYFMTSGTTSSTTFKIRCGPGSTETIYINGNSGGTRVMGGVSLATLKITEFIDY